MKFKKFINMIFIIFITFNMLACSDKIENINYQNGYPNLKGKHLVVYVASRDEVGRAFLEAFKEKTGCTYEYMRMPTEEVISRIKSERNYPKADVFMGGSCDAHFELKDENLLDQYFSKDYVNIKEKYRDKQGYWTGFEVEPLSIIVNKDRWNQEFAYKGLEIPRSYEELLNPIYKGEIVMPNPNTSGTGYTIISSLFQSLEDEDAERILSGIKKNSGQFTVNGYTPAQKVSTGEYLIGINFLGDQLLMQNSGFNIMTTVPKNAGWNIDAISKIKNGPNKDIAKYFIDFCLTKEALEILNNVSMGMSTRIDTEENKDLKFSELDIYDDYDFIKASKERDKLIKIWNNLN